MNRSPEPSQKEESELMSLREMVHEQQKLIEEQRQRIGELEEKLAKQDKRVKELEEELKASKKLKGRPKLKASRLNETEGRKRKKGKGFEKRSKKEGFEVDEERIIEPPEGSEGSRFNGYREYDVQELELHRHNIRFRLAEYVKEDGTTVAGELPLEYRGGHYGPNLRSYILQQHYDCRVPQGMIVEALGELGIEISSAQVNRILTEQTEGFAAEQEEVRKAGLESGSYIHTDDTGARHKGKNGYCTVIGNELFSYFSSGSSKSRVRFLETLQGEERSYVLNEYAQQYLQEHGLAGKHEKKLSYSQTQLAQDGESWKQYLDSLEIVTPQAVRLVTESALLGGLLEQGVSEHLRILSDGAPQFNILVHALCWIHAERGLRQLSAPTARHRENIEEMQQLLWDYYRRLQQYPHAPTIEFKTQLEQEFDQLFGRCFIHHVCLDNLLTRFRKQKEQLLAVLDCPQLPLHNNGAESDIREVVTRRKITGGTRSQAGRHSRDVLVGLKKTCRKLGLSFWAYLRSRLHYNDDVPWLPDLIRSRAQAHSLLPA